MAKPQPQYISVSRRTDIPRFFSRDFFAAWREGSVTYDGGYGRGYTVSLRDEDVLGYIFWSKDFAPFLAAPEFDALLGRANALFHFTINHCPELEPRVAPLGERLATLARLCERVGPERVLWRFDPVCRYVGSAGSARENLAPFYEILPTVAGLGIRRCYFSFMTAYAKHQRRGVRFLAFTPEEKRNLSREMAAAATKQGVHLYNCCNPELLAAASPIRQAHCIDDDLLASTDRFGRHRALQRKPTRPGCGCAASRDIGSYAQRCPHGCYYCYANPQR